MNITILARSARRAFPHRPYTDEKDVRHLRRQYVRARLWLGERWILAQVLGKKLHEHRDTAVLVVCAAGALPFLAIDVVRRFA